MKPKETMYPKLDYCIIDGVKYDVEYKDVTKWSIQVDYTARDDYGKQFRGRTTFWCEAHSIPAAYKVAENAEWGGYTPVKFGAISPGWIQMLGDRVGKKASSK